MANLRGGLRGRGGRFAALTPGLVQESDELYLLSAADRNVKVRDGLMDIKLLRRSTRTAWSGGSR